MNARNIHAQRLISLAALLLTVFVAFRVGRCTGDSENSNAQDAAPGTPDSRGDELPDAAQEWVCPMHPQIRRSEPDTCPICFMDLVAAGGAGSGSISGIPMADDAAALAGVRVETVRRQADAASVELFGRVAIADEATARITAWTDGRIERLYVDTVGERVRRGARLARIYSPRISVAGDTLVRALESLDSATESASSTRQRAAQSAVDAARRELRLLGVDNDYIEELEESRRSRDSVTIHARRSGTVLATHAREGDHVRTGDPIVSVAALDDLWVQLEVFERDLGLVAVGDPVDIRFPALSSDDSNGIYRGEIAFIDPVIDPRRRIARARVVLDPTPEGLRPDMLVEATVSLDSGDERPPVTVPNSAILWTGEQSLVYVYDPIERPPIYQPVPVTIGERRGQRTVILAGVFPGEQVVVNAAFRIDASLQIRGGASMMQVGDAPSSGGGHDHAH